MKAKLLPVPVGAKIQAWHWWRIPGVLSMTEGERAIYHGFPVRGKRLKPEQSGLLFEVRIPSR